MATARDDLRLLERMFQLFDKDRDGRLSVVRACVDVILTDFCFHIYVILCDAGRVLGSASIDQPRRYT